ncbi:MAG TPA: redox-sensing transcriptional repressor Rex [Ruminococcaceae bacterium]|nr:redox-sensing transcriptional repressor Rex [Oscillospiraceae bacterium]
MAQKQDVSISVIKRLPRYYRFLGDLLQKGINRISSRELAQIMKLTASQIRQDLNCFGGFGQQGYGYNVEALHNEIGNILGLQNGLSAIIIGAGNLGTAIAKHMNFESRGFNVIGIFDASEKVIGTQIKGMTVENVAGLESFCAKHKPQVAVLCIPKEAAKELADKLISYGIKGFWNFSHYDLGLTYENIAVENVHLGDSLMTLCYQVNKTIENA